MIQSRPIEIDGRFVGVALRREAGWRFRAVDPAYAAMNRGSFAALADIVAQVRMVPRRLPAERHDARCAGAASAQAPLSL
jgi:hypothetical protein